MWIKQCKTCWIDMDVIKIQLNDDIPMSKSYKPPHICIKVHHCKTSKINNNVIKSISNDKEQQSIVSRETSSCIVYWNEQRNQNKINQPLQDSIINDFITSFIVLFFGSMSHVRRSTCPKVHMSEGPLVRRSSCPKVHKSETTHWKTFRCYE